MARTGQQSLAQQERRALCDLLAELGPDAPTMCSGWRSADLAAHLLARDRRPDAIPGIVIRLRPLQAWTGRVQDGLRDTLTWDDLIGRVRAGPPLPLRFIDEAVNTVEYYVHHEDLRRAQLGWQPRALAPSAEAALWRRLSAMRFGPQVLSAFPGYKAPAARLEAPGRAPIVLTKRLPGPIVRGPAGEVVLWLLGRKSVAQVEVVEASGQGPVPRRS